MKEEPQLPADPSEPPSADSETPAWLRHSGKILAAHKAFFILIAGCGFLLAENVGRLASLLPKSIPDIKPYHGSLLALLIVLLGIIGLSWGRSSAFFQRWGRNREPIPWDALFPGAAAGIFLHLLREGACEGVWQTWWLVPFLALSSVCIWRLQTLANNQPPPPPESASKSLNDEPQPDITPQTDAFGRINFVSALADAVRDSDPATCHVLGVAGPWGAGKTSIINALSCKCRSADFRVISIDAWAFRETGRLTEAVLTNIVRDINQRYLFPDLKRTLARYLSIISPVVTKVPVLEALSKALAGPDELQSLKRHINDAVLSTQDRFLVIIDDVDRLDTTEFQNLLKTVRLCASIPRIVYVLVYDRRSIYQLVAKDSPSLAANFMDKVIEDEWALPLITADCLHSYLLEHLPPSAPNRSKRFSIDFEARLKQCFPAIRRLLQTPRQIKRAGISLSRRSSLISRLNPFDAFVWDLLRHQHPTLYELISRKPWLVRPDKGLEADWAVKMVFNEESRKNNLKEINDVIAQSKEDSESIHELFWTLFHNREPSSESAEFLDLRLRRISSSRFFDAYFLLEPGENLNRLEEVDGLIADVNKADTDESASALLSHSLREALRQQWLGVWIALMKVYTEELKPERIRTAISVFCKHSDIAVNPLSGIAADNAFNMARLNAGLVAQLPDNQEATVVVLELLENTRSIIVASTYLTYLRPDNLAYGKRQPDKSKCSAVFDHRLETELMSQGSQLFNMPSQVLRTLIFNYSDKTKLWEFVAKSAANTPRHWAKVIAQFADFWKSDPPLGFDQLPIYLRNPSERAHGVLEEAGLSQVADEDQDATKAFLAWYSSARPNTPHQ